MAIFFDANKRNYFSDRNRFLLGIVYCSEAHIDSVFLIDNHVMDGGSLVYVYWCAECDIYQNSFDGNLLKDYKETIVFNILESGDSMVMSDG